MRISYKEKAERYDAVKERLKQEKELYTNKLKDVQDDLEKSSDNIACMFIGKKFAYMDFVESLEAMLKL